MIIVKEKNLNAADLAIEFLKAGKVIAFATDTVYGIACDANNDKAVESLYKIKNRNKKKPIAILLKDLKAAEKIFIFDETAKKIAKKFLPGALTIILKTKAGASKNISKKLNSNLDGFLGFRIIDKEFIINLFQKFDGILALTSANISEQESATSASEVKKSFQDLDMLLIDGGKTKEKIASTIIKISNNKITLLRKGKIDNFLDIVNL